MQLALLPPYLKNWGCVTFISQCRKSRWLNVEPVLEITLTMFNRRKKDWNANWVNVTFPTIKQSWYSVVNLINQNSTSNQRWRTLRFVVESTKIISTLYRRLVANVGPTFVRCRRNNVDVTLLTFQPIYSLGNTVRVKVSAFRGLSVTKWHTSFFIV